MATTKACIIIHDNMTINGTEFDDPRENPPPKRDMREYKDGARTTVREIWVTGYTLSGEYAEAAMYPVTMNNHGVCTFDGRQVKNEEEKRLLKDVFDALFEASNH